MPDPLVAQLRHACRLPLALVGVGNPLRGDDGFGPAVLAALPACPGLTCFDAGMAPENWLGPIARATPATILVLDAADLRQPPGTLRLLRPDASDADTIGISTHGLPLGVFLRLAQDRCAAPAWLLAAQPARLSLGEEMSNPMTAAVRRAAQAIAQAFAPAPSDSPPAA